MDHTSVLRLAEHAAKRLPTRSGAFVRTWLGLFFREIECRISRMYVILSIMPSSVLSATWVTAWAVAVRKLRLTARVQRAQNVSFVRVRT